MWLLMENHPDGLRSWICWGLDEASLVEQAAIAHGRWAIETVCTASRKQPSVSVEMPESISSRGLPLPCGVEV